MSEVLGPGSIDAADISVAAQRLAQGGLVAFPTETVYGLGARADQDAAVAGIFLAKGRPSDHPLIVHVTGVEAAKAFTSDWTEAADRLARHFWPGPVTVVLARRAGRAAAAAGGQDSVGLRCPAHPSAQALLKAAWAMGVEGVAAPSANRFGRVSPTTAAHVRNEFDGADILVLDGGACPVGIESAIVDARDSARPVLLRPGTVDRAALEAALGVPLHEPDHQAPRVSGRLASHYAPSKPVRLWTSSELEAALRSSLEIPADQAPARGVAVYSRSRPVSSAGSACKVWRQMPQDPQRAAQELFAVLRELDQADVDDIWIEAPPPDMRWEGVRDRLHRASAKQ